MQYTYGLSIRYERRLPLRGSSPKRGGLQFFVDLPVGRMLQNVLRSVVMERRPGVGSALFERRKQGGLARPVSLVQFV